VDGLCVDTQGNIYTSTGKGVNIYTPTGELLGKIDSHGKDVVNMAFGGADNKTLFVMGHQEVMSVDLLVAGLTN